MKNILPIYYQIKQAIINLIQDKEFEAGQKIPSTDQLAQKYNVSHLTVRQAVEELIQEGFLESRQGSGTYVSDNKTLLDMLSIEITGFMDEVFREVQKIKTTSVKINIIKPTDLIRKKLQLPTGEKKVLKIDRVRCLNEKPFNYATNYLPIKIGTKISEEDLYKKPLMQILEQNLKLKLDSAHQTIQASYADQDIAISLGISRGTPTLFVERIVYTEKNKPTHILHASYRGDLFKFVVRLKNVREKNKNIWMRQD